MAGFNVTSGRKTNYVGKVVEADFQKPIAYDGHVLQLTLELEDGNVWSESYSIGKNWQIISPSEIVSTVGATDIVSTSMYGRFITKVASLPNGAETLEKIVADGKDALDASAWVGFTFLFEEETIDFGKKLEKVTKNMPSEIISYGAVSGEPTVDLEEVLRQIASSSATQQSFFGAAMAVAGVSSNGKLVDRLGEIWKETRQ